MVPNEQNAPENESNALMEGLDFDSQPTNEEVVADERDSATVEGATGGPSLTKAAAGDVYLEDEANPDKGLPFSAPSAVAGEQWVPYGDLKLWKHHPAAESRLRAANFKALCASASDLAHIPPLTVMQTEDGIVVVDGRLRHHAVGVVHGEDSDIAMRCVFFEGTEEEAVQTVADSALGGMPRSAIETARAIWNLQRVAGISQKAIGERYSVLKKDQVSRMTIAARTVERFPIVFELLAEPDRVPIDTCVKFAQFMKAATDAERAKVLETAEMRLSEGVSLKAGELFDALDLVGEDSGGNANKPTASDATDVLETIPVLGFDDQPVGAVEKLDDRVMRLQLPDPTTMTSDERELAAQAFIAEIRAYFGLKIAG